ncbi:hypothetical protein HNQ07_000885 [Deinococcus metalli]|uniref:Uncharacterized protein n=1 Tax=Deinococcus metalli TaxID=1141878 RepID=A0A7W8NN79_9DEIO|nr:hypothetical protein [Deinococcus metalli]MBB5375441.1 hypothetical protein [Deinococcus metalli]GHF29260.1 hypothetical protein GCM10017781_01540 [Deinococcus metalli]
MYQPPAAIEAWRYLQSLACTHAVYELRRNGTTTHYVAISQDGQIIATGVDTSEGHANVLALIGALRVVVRPPPPT